ncbi:MAG: DUF1232 domain-containing protein [Bacteroidales bacterium]|jgi:uncharacterized membrane protein YkvA (DUF1232 family)|nr:DUF1232 domain-containing protein [Bacteroidales bacterium]
MKKETDFYGKLRTRIVNWLETETGRKNKWADYLLLVPDFFYLLIKLATDEGVPSHEKAKLILAIAYFISPIDILPEAFLGPLGYLDDLALSAYVLNGIVNKVSPEIVQKYWAGEGDALLLIKGVLAKADDMIGSGLWRKLKKVVS